MKIPNKLTQITGRAILQSRAKSPTVLFAAGVVGVVGTVVLASRATLKLDRILDDMSKEKQELENLGSGDENHKKDMVFFYVRSAKEIAVLYLPTVAVGAASIGALTGAHNILSKRNVALTAAYAGLEQTFKDYRERVAEEFGDDADLKARYGAERVENTKKGEVVVHAPRTLVNPLYARFFDESCTSWNRRQDYNMIFLEMQQTYFNNLLHARGHVFLNEVYDNLGFERTQAGQIMGWVITKDGSTDGHVDFGLFDSDDDRKRAFVNGNESAILLDFNVTNVYDRL